jgi:hypothetical protein
MFNFCLPFTLLLVLAFSAVASAQESSLMWLGEYIRFSELPILQPDHSKYSERDLERLREKMQAIRSAGRQNQWEGRFVPGGMDYLNISILELSADAGFARLVIYTCLPQLRAIDFGRVNVGSDTIELVSEEIPGSPRKPERITFVKIKWGDRFFLVEENALPAWSEKAAGTFIVQDDYTHPWANFWFTGDFENDPAGEPEFPDRFKHLKRDPIKSHILSVTSRSIEKDVDTGHSFHIADSAVYRVVIGAGRKHGVKKGMVFQLLGMSDVLTITEVSSDRASGLIVRAIVNPQTDHCLSDSIEPEPIECPKIKVGTKISTKVGNFWF